MPMNAVLFDLDGTLLPFDLDEFMGAYFRCLAPYFSDMYKPDELVAWVLRAMRQVVDNESPTLTNEEKFRSALFDGDPAKTGIAWPIFERFYETSFEELRHLTHPTKIAREICRTLIEKGYRVVLATNPVFPCVATRARMRWAGIGDIPFDVVTTMENSHFCKPNPKYFLEILDNMGMSAEDCLMVGNDVQEDGVATYVGMQAYLVTDHRIDRGLGTVPWIAEGTLADFYAYVQQLPDVKA